MSSDLIEILLQRSKETAALLRRLYHAPAKKSAAARAGLAASEPLEFYLLRLKEKSIGAKWHALND